MCQAWVRGCGGAGPPATSYAPGPKSEQTRQEHRERKKIKEGLTHLYTSRAWFIRKLVLEKNKQGEEGLLQKVGDVPLQTPGADLPERGVFRESSPAGTEGCFRQRGLSYRLQASLLMPSSATDGSSKRKENGGELSLPGEAQRISVSLFL